jgi:enoyl-[acyl-carrier protein] reductase II
MNRITQLFNIKYPIVQAGMIWCSGWELAAAVSNAGGLGLIGSGSMTAEELRKNIIQCRKTTSKPFGVNIPLLFHGVEEMIEVVISEKVAVVFTSAGNPSKYTSLLKSHGIKVAHVVANVKFAKKCQDAGVDALVAEGFEAGGHNGKEETTSMVLIPLVRDAVSIPLIAAGGIGCGRSMLAAMALGADGVQIGSRFVASEESCAHPAFKQSLLNASEGDTSLLMKKLVPVRLLKNPFSEIIEKMESEGATAEQLAEFLGKGRAQKGMSLGQLEEGELEIGQVSAMISEVKPAAEIVREIITEFNKSAHNISSLHFPI